MVVLDSQSTDEENGCEAVHIQEVENAVVLKLA